MRTVRIVETATGKVAKESDVTGQSEGYIDRLVRGMEINLNHAEYHVTDSGPEES